MNILPYLAQYLTLHKKVVVSGLGNFSLVRKKGLFVLTDNTFYPPCYEVEFYLKDAECSNLAQYISTQCNINISRAQKYIQNLVEIIQLELENNQNYSVENIGILRAINYKIKLIAQLESYVNNAFFGLKPVIVESLHNHPITLPIENELPIAPIIKPIINRADNNDFPLTYSLAEQALKTARHNEPYTKSESQFSWFWFFAVIMLVLTSLIIAATLYYFPPFKSEIAELSLHQKQIIPVTIPSKKNKVILPAVYSSQFEIIVRENLNQLKAESIIKNLKTSGLKAYILLDSSSQLNQISVAKFYNSDSANAQLKIIQLKYYPNAYLKTSEISK